MKLYMVQNNTRIRLMENADVPPHAAGCPVDSELDFRHIDGMYSLCYNDAGDAVHPAALTEVEVVET